MRILLIAPASEALRVTSEHNPGGARVFRFSLLSLLTVAACTPEGHEVRIVDEQTEPIDFDAEVDLVGVTFMTAHAPRAYEIADAFARRGVMTVAGGYHASFMAEEAVRHFDAVVVGEAEPTWPRVVADAARGRLAGIYRADAPADLATLTRPPRKLLKPGRYATINAMQAGRGCPNGCRFCSVTQFFNRTHRLRPIDQVVDELASIDSRFVVFVDDNIIGDTAYAKALFRAMAPLGKRWISQASITIADDPELLDLAARAGCTALFVGLETLNGQALAESDKAFNRVDEYRQSVKRLHDHRIGVESGIVFGFDADRSDVFEHTLEMVRRIELDAIQVSILTPLPGTPLYDQMLAAGRIFDFDWRHYDYRHAVFHPQQMSAAELENGANWVIEQFYGAGAIARRVARSLWQLGVMPTALMSLPVNVGYWHRVRQWRIHGQHPVEYAARVRAERAELEATQRSSRRRTVSGAVASPSSSRRSENGLCVKRITPSVAERAEAVASLN